MKEFEVFRCRTCRHWRVDPDDPAIWLQKHGVRCCHKWSRGYKDEPLQDGALVENDEGWGAITGPDFGCIQHSELQRSAPPPLTPQMRETLDRLNALVADRRAAGDEAARYYGGNHAEDATLYRAPASTAIDRLERPK